MVQRSVGGMLISAMLRYLQVLPPLLFAVLEATDEEVREGVVVVEVLRVGNNELEVNATDVIETGLGVLVEQARDRSLIVRDSTYASDATMGDP